MSRRRFASSEPLPLALKRRRIYILPTGYGVLFAAVLAAMLMGALNYNNNLAFMLTFLLVGIVLVSIVRGYRNLEQMTIAGISAEPVFVGRKACFRVRLDAGARTRRAVLLTLDETTADPVDLPADLETAVEIAVPAPRRGLIQVQRLTVSSSYPLGLCRTWSRLHPQAVALVYPRPLASALPIGLNGGGNGDRSLLHPGVEDFQGLRAYQPGDAPRRIHWKSFARGQGLFTKQFAAAASSSSGLLDWFAVPETDPEKKIGILCHAVLTAERQKASYGLRLPDRLLPPSVGANHRHRCLQALALMPQPDPAAP